MEEEEITAQTEPQEYAVNFVYTEYSELKPRSVRLPGDTVVSSLIPQAEALVAQMFDSAGLSLPPTASVVLGMFSTLLPASKTSGNTTIAELVSYGGHIIVEVQLPPEKEDPNDNDNDNDDGGKMGNALPVIRGKNKSIRPRKGKWGGRKGRGKGRRKKGEEKDPAPSPSGGGGSESSSGKEAGVGGEKRVFFLSQVQAGKAAEEALGEVTLALEEAREEVEWERKEREGAEKAAKSQIGALKDLVAEQKADLRTLQDAKDKQGKRASDRLASVRSKLEKVQAEADAASAAVRDLEWKTQVQAQDLGAAQTSVSDLQAKIEGLEVANRELETQLKEATSGGGGNGGSGEGEGGEGLRLENARLRALSRSLRSRFADLRTRLKGEMRTQIQLQVQAQQAVMAQHLQTQLMALQSAFYEQQAALRDEITSQFVEHVESVESRAARIEAASKSLSSEVDVLMTSLQTSQQQYNDLYSAISEDYEQRSSISTEEGICDDFDLGMLSPSGPGPGLPTTSSASSLASASSWGSMNT